MHLHSFREADSEDIHSLNQSLGHGGGDCQPLGADCGVFLLEDGEIVVILVELLCQVIAVICHKSRAHGISGLADLVRERSQDLYKLNLRTGKIYRCRDDIEILYRCMQNALFDGSLFVHQNIIAGIVEPFLGNAHSVALLSIDLILA